MAALLPLTYPGGVPGHASRQTSLEAALGVLPRLKERQMAVLRYLVSIWPAGATDDELDAHFGAVATRTARVRRCELARLPETPLVLDSGERRATPSGRPAIVWRANMRQRQGALL